MAYQILEEKGGDKRIFIPVLGGSVKGLKRATGEIHGDSLKINSSKKSYIYEKLPESIIKKIVKTGGVICLPIGQMGDLMHFEIPHNAILVG